MNTDLRTDERIKKEKGQKLKEEVLELLEWMDHLLLQQGPRIESEYWSLFGPLEKALHEAYLGYHRLYRKRELLMTALQRGEEPALDEIEEQLDIELRHYMDELEELERIYQKALLRARSASHLSDEESERLKRLYRDFVKAYHPDLKGELTDAEKNLWLQAQSAYEMGDLSSMEMFHVLLDDISDVKEDLVYLEERRDYIKEKIKVILLQPPLSWQIFLQGEEKEKRVAYLEGIVEAYSSAIKQIEEDISILSRKRGILH